MTVYFAATVYSGTPTLGLILIGVSFQQINKIPYISNKYDFDIPSHFPQNCMKLILQLPMRQGRGTKLLLAWYYV